MPGQSSLFVVGDVHGCYHTFCELLRAWDPQKELLVQVGDLINKGNFSPQTVALARRLQAEHGAVFLLGNHERGAILEQDGAYWPKWHKSFTMPTLAQYRLAGADYAADVNWFRTNPLFWSNPHLLVSHAGISTLSENPFDLDDKYSLIWNRAPIAKIKQLQIIGHTPLLDGKPLWLPDLGYCNIDTGSFIGLNLTALRIGTDGSNPEFVQAKTQDQDLAD